MVHVRKARVHLRKGRVRRRGWHAKLAQPSERCQYDNDRSKRKSGDENIGIWLLNCARAVRIDGDRWIIRRPYAGCHPDAERNTKAINCLQDYRTHDSVMKREGMDDVLLSISVRRAIACRYLRCVLGV